MKGHKILGLIMSVILATMPLASGCSSADEEDGLTSASLPTASSWTPSSPKESSSPVSSSKVAGSSSGPGAGVSGPPEGTMVTFGVPVSFAPAGCTVSEATAMPAGQGILGVVIANCGGAHQAYSIPLTGDGVATGKPTLISTSCQESRSTVSQLVSEAGANGFAVSFLCETPMGVYQRGMSFLNGSGQVITSFLLPKTYSKEKGAKPVLFAFNPVAAAYGVATDLVFQRYNEQGQSLGGAISVPASYGYPITSVQSGQGYWTVLESSGYGTTSCSKVSPVGTLECSKLPLASITGPVVSINAGATIATAIGKESDTISYASFNPVACALTTAPSKGQVAGVIDDYYGSASFDARTIAFLYSDSKSNLVVAFLNTTEGKILSTSKAMATTKISTGNIFSHNHKLYVAVAANNDALLIVGNDHAPQ